MEFVYDPLHRRLCKSVIENKRVKKQLYLYDGNLEIGATNAQGVIEELRVLGEGIGEEIGSAVFIEVKGQTYIPLHDHRGCVVTLLDPSKKKSAGTYRYIAFGEETVSGVVSPWRFASKRVDETGSVHFGRRDYLPSLGRWMSPDPQGFEDRPNLYAYLQNSPLLDIDPYGLWS